MTDSDLKTITELGTCLSDLTRQRDTVIAQIKAWAEDHSPPPTLRDSEAWANCSPAEPPTPTVSKFDCIPAAAEKPARQSKTRGQRMCRNEDGDISIGFAGTVRVFWHVAKHYPNLAATVAAAIDDACAAEREETVHDIVEFLKEHFGQGISQIVLRRFAPARATSAEGK